MENTEFQLQKMEERLDEMENKLDDLEVKIDSIDNKLNQVIDALRGNPLVKSDGLVARFEKFEREVQELKDFKKRILYSVSAIVALGLLMEFIIKLYANVNK
jgi:phage shock protein A